MALTFEERYALKHLVSEARQQQLRKHFDARSHCGKCGVPKDENNPTCSSCYSRHRRRAMRREDAIPRRDLARILGLCIGCGVPHHERTPGCIRCRDRERYKRYRPA